MHWRQIPQKIQYKEIKGQKGQTGIVEEKSVLPPA